MQSVELLLSVNSDLRKAREQIKIWGDRIIHLEMTQAEIEISISAGIKDVEDKSATEDHIGEKKVLVK